MDSSTVYPPNSHCITQEEKIHRYFVFVLIMCGPMKAFRRNMMTQYEWDKILLLSQGIT